MAKIYRAKRSFAYGAGGVTRMMAAGRIVAADDPALAGRSDLLNNASLFEPLDSFVARSTGGVEQATAAPGEKRSVSRPARRAPAKEAGAKESAGKGGSAKSADDKSGTDKAGDSK